MCIDEYGSIAKSCLSVSIFSCNVVAIARGHHDHLIVVQLIS